MAVSRFFCFFFQAEDGIRDIGVTGVQTCALPISAKALPRMRFTASRARKADVKPVSADGFCCLASPAQQARNGAGLCRWFGPPELALCSRSEERRVGKECRARGWLRHEEKKQT